MTSKSTISQPKKTTSQNIPFSEELPSPTSGKNHIYLTSDYVMGVVDRATAIETYHRITKDYGDIDLLRLVIENQPHIMVYIRDLDAAWLWHRGTLIAELKAASPKTLKHCAAILGSVLLAECGCLPQMDRKPPP